MLTKKRTSYEFLATVVEGCKEPITITNLYYKLKTSYDVLDRWLKTAIRFKLIKNMNNKYRVTDKGVKFLGVWSELQAFLKEE